MAAPTVLVTGASSGLGDAIAHRFAQSGATVYGTSRRLMPEANGIRMLRLDLRSQASIDACVAAIGERSGALDVLVNNAGVFHAGMAEETSLATGREVFDTNFFGVVALVDRVLPGMRARRSGHIINVGSLSAWIAEPGEAFYSASKRALAGYTEALRHEVRGCGIKVSLVEPGAFRTDVLGSALTNSTRIVDYDDVRDAVATTLAKGVAGGGDPRAVADLVFAIAGMSSPRSRYPAGLDAKILPYLRLLMPQKAFEYLVRKGYGLVR